MAVAGGDFEGIVMQAVKRELDDEIWDAVCKQRRRGAAPATPNFIGIPAQEFLALYWSAGAQGALAELAEKNIAPPPYPGHLFGPQPRGMRAPARRSVAAMSTKFLLVLL